MERKYLRVQELLKMLNISKATLYRLSRREDFPRPVKLSRKLVMYNITEILSWLEKQREKNGLI